MVAGGGCKALITPERMEDKQTDSPQYQRCCGQTCMWSGAATGCRTTPQSSRPLRQDIDGEQAQSDAGLR